MHSALVLETLEGEGGPLVVSQRRSAIASISLSAPATAEVLVDASASQPPEPV